MGVLNPAGGVGRFNRRGGVRSPSGFAPTNLTGCVAWFNADQIAQADASAVAAWADQSGNANNLSQGTSGNRPTYKTAIVNGHAVVRFAGSHWLDAGDVLRVTQPTIFVVAAATTAATTQCFVNKGGSGAYFPAYSIMIVGGKGRTQIGHGAEITALETLALSNSTFYLYEGRYDQVNVEAWLNGTNHAQAADTTAPTFNTDPFRVGAMSDGAVSIKLTGDIAEVVVYNRALTAAERQQVEAYLDVKYALGF